MRFEQVHNIRKNDFAVSEAILLEAVQERDEARAKVAELEKQLAEAKAEASKASD